jgi:hypothetical protein
MELFTRQNGNTKMAKDKGRAESVILHLSPYLKSGRQVCSFADQDNTEYAKQYVKTGQNVAVVFRDFIPHTFWNTRVIDATTSDLRPLDVSGIICGLITKGIAKKTKQKKLNCWRYCLDRSGRNFRIDDSEITQIDKARKRKTDFYFDDRKAFLKRLHHELELLEIRSKKKQKQAYVRLNGTSDIIWERIDRSIFDSHSSINFYDYTKVPNRDVSTIDNYSLTYSLQGIYDPIKEHRI